VLPSDPISNSNTPAEKYLKELVNIMKKAEESLKRAKETMKNQWDRTKQKMKIFEVGDQVFVQADYLPSRRSSKKLNDKWRGPFRILAKKGEAVYELELPPTWKGHRTINASWLKECIPPSFPKQAGLMARPDPVVMADGKEEYEVHEILDHQVKNRGKEYLVRWKDYGLEDDTWEPEDNLGNAKEALKDFWSRGQDQRREGYHVTAVTKQTDQPKPGPTRTAAEQLSWLKPGLIRVLTESIDGLNHLVYSETGEQDNRISVMVDGVSVVTDGNRWEMMGKLCHRALVLIKHKVGADMSISDCMVQALETWLRTKGITIYTERLL
jgi:hypothetical protein